MVIHGGDVMNVGLGKFGSYAVVLQGATDSGVDGWINTIVQDNTTGDRIMQNCKRSSAAANTGTVILQENQGGNIVMIEWPADWVYQVEVL